MPLPCQVKLNVSSEGLVTEANRPDLRGEGFQHGAIIATNRPLFRKKLSTWASFRRQVLAYQPESKQCCPSIARDGRQLRGDAVVVTPAKVFSRAVGSVAWQPRRRHAHYNMPSEMKTPTGLIYTGAHHERGPRPPSELCCWQPCRVFLLNSFDSLAMAAMNATGTNVAEELQIAAVVSELSGSYGSILLGTFGGLLLYGLGVHQLYRYIRSFSKDALYIRSLVISVMVFETVHLIATMHTCYFYLVQNYFAPLVLLDGVWSLDSLPFLSGILIIISQIFFVRRASLIGPRERAVAILVAICLAGEFGFTIAAVIRAFIPPAKATVRLLSTAGLGMASAADLALSLVLFFAILGSRRGRARPESETLADRVQLYVVNTGLAATVCNVLAFFTALTLDINSLVWVSFNIIATRLYANSLLAVLNSRELRGMEFFVSENHSVTLTGPQFEDPANLWNAPKARSADSFSETFDFKRSPERAV